MKPSLILACFAVAILAGCSAPKYSIVESEFSYEKTNGVKYFSKKPIKINNETGESFLMDYSKADSYHWRLINELNSDPVTK